MGRLQRGDDLLESLTNLAGKQQIDLGEVSALGAVEKAVTGYYDQHKRKYAFTEHNEPMEIVSLTGNISLREGKIMVHAHIALAGEDGSVIGGHLAPGTIVFACEYRITAFKGERLERKTDSHTGLPLWSD